MTNIILKYEDTNHTIICKILIEFYQLSSSNLTIMDDLGIRFPDNSLDFEISEESLTFLKIKHGNYWCEKNND